MNGEELKRLDTISKPSQTSDGAGTVSLVSQCKRNAEDVLASTKEVLRIVLQISEPWPSLEQWRGLLPRWFLDSCSPELSDMEKEAWKTWWSTQSEAERQRFTKEAPWRLSAWISSMHPERRTWFWWSSMAIDADQLQVDLTVREWPTALGSISWLLRAAGAEHVAVKAK